MLKRAWLYAKGASAIFACASTYTICKYRPRHSDDVDFYEQQTTVDLRPPNAVEATLYNAGSNFIIAATTAALRGIMHLLHPIEYKDSGKLAQYLSAPRDGVPLVTVINHVSIFDDPGLMSVMVPPEVLLHPSRMRWGICTEEMCFWQAGLATYFGAGRAIPVTRGGSIHQRALSRLQAKLEDGEWVNVFSEAKTWQEQGVPLRDEEGRWCTRSGSRCGLPWSRVGPLKWGVGKIIANSSITPIVLPIFQTGLNDTIPQDRENEVVIPPHLFSGALLSIQPGDAVPVVDLIDDYFEAAAQRALARNAARAKRLQDAGGAASTGGIFGSFFTGGASSRGGGGEASLSPPTSILTTEERVARDKLIAQEAKALSENMVKAAAAAASASSSSSASSSNPLQFLTTPLSPASKCLPSNNNNSSISMFSSSSSAYSKSVSFPSPILGSIAETIEAQCTAPPATQSGSSPSTSKSSSSPSNPPTAALSGSPGPRKTLPPPPSLSSFPFYEGSEDADAAAGRSSSSSSTSLSSSSSSGGVKLVPTRKLTTGIVVPAFLDMPPRIRPPDYAFLSVSEAFAEEEYSLKLYGDITNRIEKALAVLERSVMAARAGQGYIEGRPMEAVGLPAGPTGERYARDVAKLQDPILSRAEKTLDEARVRIAREASTRVHRLLETDRNGSDSSSSSSSSSSEGGRKEGTLSVQQKSAATAAAPTSFASMTASEKAKALADLKGRLALPPSKYAALEAILLGGGSSGSGTGATTDSVGPLHVHGARAVTSEGSTGMVPSPVYPALIDKAFAMYAAKKGSDQL